MGARFDIVGKQLMNITGENTPAPTEVPSVTPIGHEEL